MEITKGREYADGVKKVLAGRKALVLLGRRAGHRRWPIAEGGLRNAGRFR